jgi:peptidyl-prolyl cis-trans isomerase B (cyclophilin B)
MPSNRQAEVFEAVKDVDLDKNDYLIALNTNHGRILLDLVADDAPGHVLNMIGLTKIGYYDGVSFHRIISGFMIQGGCPDGNGTGGPGYTIKAEFNSMPHAPGVLSMARTNDPNSAGSQFFICLERVPHLDGQYTAFGRTADDASLEVVRAIGAVATDASDKPTTPVIIETAKVIERPKP